MRVIYILSFLTTVTFYSAQQFCATDKVRARWFAAHPELKTKYEQAFQKQKAAQKLIPPVSQQGAAAVADYTIPVVFHILHQGGSENITDAQVKDAVMILARDYKKENADTANVVSAFKNLIGKPNIHFQLASVDPQGKCTNGIIRYWDDNTIDWVGDSDEYAYTWPHDKYLNIYVVKSIDPNMGAAAYTYLPEMWVSDEMDAIVTMSHYVGSIGTGAPVRSRVLTHEVGHWLGLEHVWGWNQVGVSCGDDGVSDTPETRGYQTCNLTNNDFCNPGYPENVQNYMDYSYCNKMFTIGQAWWMTNALNSNTQNRQNLSSPNNLAFTLGQGSSCLTRLDILPFPSLTVCTGGTFAVVSYTSNIEASSMLWSAPNAIITSPGSASTVIQFTSAGQYVIKCEATGSGGTVTKTIAAKVVDGTPEITVLNSESFESASPLPDGWKSVYTSASYQWVKTTDASSHDETSMMIKGESFPAGITAILESPSYDLKNNPGAIFTFKYAYARKTNTHQDIFKVQASTDCGGTWKDVYLPGAASLAQGSGEVSSTIFTPDESLWKFYILSSHPNYKPLIKESNVRFRFSFTEYQNAFNGGNRFYLDEINFTPLVSDVGLTELLRSLDLSLFPNPTHGAVQVQFTLSDETQVAYRVTSITGAVMSESAGELMTPGTHELLINTDNKLTEGIYFLNIRLNGVTVCKKMVVH